MTKPPIILQVLNYSVSFLERAFVMPVCAIALLLFYNDQRTRQEGYDIELLMAQAGWQELPPPPTEPVILPTPALAAETQVEPTAEAVPAPAPEPVAQSIAPQPAPAEDSPEVTGP